MPAPAQAAPATQFDEVSEMDESGTFEGGERIAIVFHAEGLADMKQGQRMGLFFRQGIAGNGHAEILGQARIDQ